MMAMLCWRFIAFLAVKMAAVGVIVPGVPSAPFILLAAWSAGKGWPQLEQWLLQHEKYGPLIIAWRHERAIPRSAKWLASAMMLFSAVMLLVSAAPTLLKALLALFLIAVAIWLWTRREPKFAA